ncbi:hypothetical protein CHF27_001670 [Romboutsia maritimum]|uniref:Uncharacterized protein n=1 Tax=Romboutsia maritimum TaxID=2020948 RepID=A0A371IWS7_9FIRM|nr:hypothetical protein [Romboutsia maritimum]RDY24934.1 hypothetical protein CHF27_001670 [Romboutsia maritimum]
MLKSSVIYTLVRSLPESILFIFLGNMLLEANMSKNKILQMGMLMTLIISFVRLLPITFGVHTIISIMIEVLIFTYLSGNKIIQSVIITFELFIALLLSETIYMFIAINIFKINLNVLVNRSNFISAISSIPSLLIFLGIAFIIKFFNNKVNSRGRDE